MTSTRAKRQICFYNASQTLLNICLNSERALLISMKTSRCKFRTSKFWEALNTHRKCIRAYIKALRPHQIILTILRTTVWLTMTFLTITTTRLTSDAKEKKFTNTSILWNKTLSSRRTLITKSSAQHKSAALLKLP